MDARTLSGLIVQAIKQKLSPDVSLTKYLMDLLALSPEPTYRRIHGKVPFTFEEIVTVANDLHLSIDTIIRSDATTNNSIHFTMPVDFSQESAKIFANMLEDSNMFMSKLVEVEQLNILVALNRIPLYYFYLPTLFKFDYFRFLYTREEIPFGVHLDAITLPDRLIQLHKESAAYFLNLQQITCIIENNVLSKLIKEITYFYQQKYISEENVRAMQQELIKWVETTNKRFFANSNEASGNKLYISSLPVDSNCAYYSFDEGEIALIWIYFEHPIVIMNNPVMSQLQKRWINSRKRSAVLVTESNDIMQTKLYNNMLEKIEKLSNLFGLNANLQSN